MKRYILLLACLSATLMACSGEEQATYQGKTTKQWFKSLGDADEQTQRGAAEALLALSHKDIRIFMELVDIADREQIYFPTDRLPELGSDLAASKDDAVPLLVKALVEACIGPEGGQLKFDYIAAALGGVNAEMLVPEIPELLGVLGKVGQTDGEYYQWPGNRRALLMGTMKHIVDQAHDEDIDPPRAVIDELLSACSASSNDPDIKVRRTAVQIVGVTANREVRKSGTTSEDRVRILVTYLGDPDPEESPRDRISNVRTNAAMWLGSLGADAESAVPALVQALEKENQPGAREYMEKAIARINSAVESGR